MVIFDTYPNGISAVAELIVRRGPRWATDPLKKFAPRKKIFEMNW